MTDTALPLPPRRLHRVEFVALMAMLIASIAFSIDAMLPALPEIAEELSPDDINRAQLILTIFVLGMGVGTFVTGPISDAIGRKPVIVIGAALYCTASVAAWLAGSLELLLLARFVQGLGAAGPRIVALAIIRDLYAGRDMARLMSFIMLVFTIVPAIAPTIGAGIIALVGWRGMFGAFIAFSLVSAAWLTIRQPETLPPQARKPMRAGVLWRAVKEVLSLPMVRLSILVQTLAQGMLFAVLSSTQQVYDLTYDQGAQFHFWFMGTAFLAATASILNAVLVMRLGMRLLITFALGGQIVLSSLMILFEITGPWGYGAGLTAWFLWSTSVFFMVGLTLGNLNALAMEPLGHIAGLAASIVASLATVGAVIIAIPIGLAFDGTPLPLSLGVLACSVMGFALTRSMARLERVRATL